MATFEELQEGLETITYSPDEIGGIEKYHISLVQHGSCQDVFFIQVSKHTKDPETGEFDWCKSEKMYISPECTVEEVINKAFKLCVSFAEQEVCTNFMVNGERYCQYLTKSKMEVG